MDVVLASHGRQLCQQRPRQLCAETNDEGCAQTAVLPGSQLTDGGLDVGPAFLILSEPSLELPELLLHGSQMFCLARRISRLQLSLDLSGRIDEL